MTLYKHSERKVRRPCSYCGDTELYWAHDTDKRTNRDGVAALYCEDCTISGSLVLIARNDTTSAINTGSYVDSSFRHACRNKNETTTEVHDVTDLPKAALPPAAIAQHEQRKRTATEDPRVAALMSLLNPAVDEAQVRRIVAEAVADITQPTRTVVERKDGTTKTPDGLSHSGLADVVTSLLAGEHVFLVGPAGTGKSTIGKQAAEALCVPFYEISLNPAMSPTQLLGYMNATGDYVPSLFRKAYETGGVFLLDEADNGHPSTLATLNSALSSGQMAFPDQMVKRHDDFLCVATGNTYGRGADRQYVGRQQLDAATLDRFTVITIDVDNALEDAVCHATGLDAAKVTTVLAYVRSLRRNAQSHKMTVIISPRASIGMCKLLHAGMPVETVIENRVRKGMSETDWNKVQQGVEQPSV